MTKEPKNGFSLVELSIVLVILGLLAGGILGGQSLIRASELRSVTTEYSDWQTAVNSFRLRYHTYPGDFAKATQLWGEADKCPPLNNIIFGVWNDGALSTDGSTCNGNGNRKIDTDGYLELLTFWQHLGNAGLISGNYNAYRTSEHLMGLGGESLPISRLASNASWRLEPHLLYGTQTAFYIIDSPYGGSLADMDDGVMTPAEAWGIDSKLDDGLPHSGTVTWTNVFNYGCVADADGNPLGSPAEEIGQYNLAHEGPGCSLSFAF